MKEWQRSAVVTVHGPVRNPGSMPWQEGMTVSQAITAVGGESWGSYHQIDSG